MKVVIVRMEDGNKHLFTAPTGSETQVEPMRIVLCDTIKGTHTGVCLSPVIEIDDSDAEQYMRFFNTSTDRMRSIVGIYEDPVMF